MVATMAGGGIFAITRTKILLFLLLIACWSVAHVFPSYQDTIQAKLAATRERIPSIKLDFHPQTDPRTAYNQSKLALLIEGRPQPSLVPHMLHMMSVVPADWRFLFIGSNRSVVSVSRSVPIMYQQAAGKLDLMIAPEAWDIGGKEGVWRMLTDARFYDELLPGVEWLLKYETDSIMCANSKESLNDWLHYDWAAAPRTSDDKFAGNGGLSIRRLSAVRRILSFQQRENNTQPEDEWFGKRIVSMPDLKAATAADSKHFAVEEVYHDAPMGYHLRNGEGHLPEGVWKNKDQRAKILRYCPDLAIILPMKLERERCEGDDREGAIVPVEHLGSPEEEEEAKKKAEEEADQKEEEPKEEEEEEPKEEEEEPKKEEPKKEDAKVEDSKKAEREGDDVLDTELMQELEDPVDEEK